MKQWPRPTTPRSGCPPGSGRTRAAGSCGWRSECEPASSGRTPITASTRPARSAATRNRDTDGRAAAMASPRTSVPERRDAAAPGRIGVRKTSKLFIGGAFPRSESGRSYPVHADNGDLLAQAARASRKDLRDSVVAARKAFGGWSGATAYNRGQVLYRVAELMEGRSAQFAAGVAQAERVGRRSAEALVAAAIDRWVWYAGWSDKVAQVAGAANPVAAPYFNFSVPEPTGVVVVLAPAQSSLLGLVSVLAPVIVTGNTAVVVASEDRPLPSVELAEVLATSDVPAGVVNVPTAGRAELERAAAANLKRVYSDHERWDEPPGTRRLLAPLEIKTVWHPVGT